MEVRVYANLETFSKGVPLYVRRVVGSSSVEMPFDLLLRSMRVLYGNSSVVVFVNDDVL